MSWNLFICTPGQAPHDNEPLGDLATATDAKEGEDADLDYPQRWFEQRLG